MASKNQVTLTFAGDHEKLTKSFDAVGDSAKAMDDKVSASTGGFEAATDASDTLDTRAMGFRDTVTGVQDSVSGFSKVLKGDLSADALVLAGTGVGDLASGFTNLLGPALGKTMGWLAQTRVGMLAHAAMTKTVGAATKVWTGIQAAFNFVMALNPIVLVIIAIVALVAIVIIAYKHSETFRRIVDAAFRAVVVAAKAVWDGVKLYFGFWKGIIDRVMGWVGDIPSRIGRAFRGLGDAISAPFRAGFDAVRRFWNNTIGGKGFDLPSWVPFGMGGKSFRFPFFHQGGVVPGLPGSEMLAVLQAGERVIPAGGGQSVVVLEVRSGGSRFDDALVGVIARAVSVRGGSVQPVLGGARG
jgi:hypothetical protein